MDYSNVVVYQNKPAVCVLELISFGVKLLVLYYFKQANLKTCNSANLSTIFKHALPLIVWPFFCR